MILQILILLVGLTILVVGADYLVEGSCSIAKRAGLSDFVIGMTIVGIGTSCPELVVSLIGAFQGNADIAIGNVVGSNICNIFLILGVTGLLCPVLMTRDNIRKDLPLCVGTTMLLILLGLKSTFFGAGADKLTRLEGVVLILLFIAYIVYLLKAGGAKDGDDEGGGAPKERKLVLTIMMTVGGLAGLVLGGRMFVQSAERIALAVGMSDKFIAITILALGTSMPELVTSVVAAAKKKGQLALGNVIGSNICNILLILGCSAVVHPLSFGSITFVDLGVLMLGPIFLLICAWTGRDNRIGRCDGAFLLACEVAYMVWLTVNL